ncbi:hypothetical protein [Mangrovicella endophytica]|uniref:hypothetical protein n=1 Tax=Mangrovicella endophytica TaxID=2066697 RepID=UPI000C9DC481|nr:hypothetical protein [Mangrovicella endophytica]
MASLDFLCRRFRKNTALAGDLIGRAADEDPQAVVADYCNETFVDYADALSAGLADLAERVEQLRLTLRRVTDAIIDDLSARTIAP